MRRFEPCRKGSKMRPRGARRSPRIVDQSRSLASNLTKTLIDHKHKLPPDLGRPRPRLLLFVVPSLKREATTIAALFK